MRLKYLLACTAIAATTTGAAILGCYAPGDLGPTPYRCYADHPECPDGYECQLTSAPNPKNMNKCVMIGGGMMLNITLPTQPTVYMGTMAMSGLTSQNCPSMYDNDLESTNGGNNSIGTATGGFDDATTHDKLAICPAGDLDVYTINVPAGNYVRVKVTYMIRFGDLDVALYDSNGNLAMIGGNSLYDVDSTNDNACIVTTATAMTGQTYYAVVYGARNSTNSTDQNSYTLKIDMQTSKTNFTCAGGTPPDMSIGDATIDLR
jgi:hypothetical protein